MRAEQYVTCILTLKKRWLSCVIVSPTEMPCSVCVLRPARLSGATALICDAVKVSVSQTVKTNAHELTMWTSTIITKHNWFRNSGSPQIRNKTLFNLWHCITFAGWWDYWPLKSILQEKPHPPHQLPCCVNLYQLNEAVFCIQATNAKKLWRSGPKTLQINQWPMQYFACWCIAYSLDVSVGRLLNLVSSGQTTPDVVV